MSGFWTKTPDGHVAHIDGDRDMSQETLEKLHKMLDLASRQVEQRLKDFDQLWENIAPESKRAIPRELAYWWFESGYDLAQQRQRERAGVEIAKEQGES